MSKEAVFTMKLEPELRDAFMAATALADRPASQVVREMMRDYIAQHSQPGDYDDYLQAKIDKARASVKAGRVRSNAEVEATFAAKRKQLLEGKA